MTALSLALAQIPSCHYRVMPIAIPNIFIDPSQTELHYYPAGQAPFISLTRSTDGCQTDEWGWDPNREGTSFSLCETACETIRADEDGWLLASYGCPTTP